LQAQSLQREIEEVSKNLGSGYDVEDRRSVKDPLKTWRLSKHLQEILSDDEWPLSINKTNVTGSNPINPA